MEKIKNLALVTALIATGGAIAALLVFVGPLKPEADEAVKAQSTLLQVVIGPDACPNISGPQASVPDGMVKDSNGNCYTPAPPPTDVCPNISGTQESIPAGYYKATDGNCYRQPVPPRDVCPNISGTQESTPDGMINDADGNCVEPPKDECPNITGPQPILPAGMRKDDDGNCYTPPPPPLPPAAPVTPPRSGTGQPKNVPAFMAPAVQAIVNLVPETVKQAVKSVPPVVAKTFPYYIFIILGAVSMIMLWQAVREAIAAKRLYVILKREKLIAEEKDNFIALSSHYLHTPLTVMRNGVDTIAALKEVSQDLIQPLSTAIASLKDRIDAILNDVESNKALGSIAAPQIPDVKLRTLSSPYFWIPVAAAGGLTLLSNFLLGIVGEVDLGIGNLWGQVIVLGAVSLLLYNGLRTRHIRKTERENTQRLINHERAIDAARNDFIQQSTIALRDGLQEVENTRGAIADAPSAKFFNDGYQRFANILAKFTLLSQIETGASAGMVTFNIRDAVNNSLLQQQDKITEKQLSITNKVEDLEVLQNRVLFGFVLNSVIDNAIKFSNEGGSIEISAIPDAHTMEVRVSDNGIGVPEDKLPHLFKPFSRAGSALQFDYEGLGFSLFLDKIIMDYLGGDITADSEVNKGTVVTVKA